MISRAVKPIILTSLFLSLFLPPPAKAETLSNAGFAPETVWFSKEPFFDGEEVKIYTALYNSREEHLSGNIVFRNGSEKIGETPFSLQSGSAQNVWTAWTAKGGEVVISAEIENASISSGGESRSVSLEKQKGENRKFVDKDTDGDGVGNLADEDDDGDGVSDRTEIASGTNPLSADSDKDGVPDGKDRNPLVADETDAPELPVLFENLSENVPQTVTKSASKIFEKTEELRENQLAYSQKKIDEIKGLLEEADGESAETAGAEKTSPESGYFKNFLSAAALYGLDLQSIFRYLSLAFHYVNLYIFKWQIVFYAILLLGVYYLTRRLWRINRGDSFK